MNVMSASANPASRRKNPGQKGGSTFGAAAFGRNSDDREIGEPAEEPQGEADTEGDVPREIAGRLQCWERLQHKHDGGDEDRRSKQQHQGRSAPGAAPHFLKGNPHARGCAPCPSTAITTPATGENSHARSQTARLPAEHALSIQVNGGDWSGSWVCCAATMAAF